MSFNSPMAKVTTSCRPIVFAYDAYLGFPAQDPLWKQFFTKHCVQLKPYYDINKLVVDLKHHQLEAAFLPAGGYYYLRDDIYYQPVASATLGRERKVTEKSYLLVKRKSTITQPEQLKNKKWAYVNQECTTSFFAPIIYLAQHKLPLKNYFNKLNAVDGFNAQVEAINHPSKIDVTMLWSPYWLKNKVLQSNTRIIGSINNLPTPVIILARTSHKQFKIKFIENLIHYKSNHLSWEYSGFTFYQDALNKQFWKKITKSYQN